MLNIRAVINHMINQEIESMLNTSKYNIDWENNLVNNLHNSIKLMIEISVKENLHTLYKNKENLINVIKNDIIYSNINGDGLISLLIYNENMRIKKLLLSNIERIESNTRFNINMKHENDNVIITCSYENKSVTLFNFNDISVFNSIDEFIKDSNFKPYFITWVINSDCEKHIIVSYTGLDILCKYISNFFTVS